MTSSVSLIKRPKVTGTKTVDEDLNLQCTDAIDVTTDDKMVEVIGKESFKLSKEKKTQKDYILSKGVDYWGT